MGLIKACLSGQFRQICGAFGTGMLVLGVILCDLPAK
jgi:hypothetical protein